MSEEKGISLKVGKKDAAAAVSRSHAFTLGQEGPRDRMPKEGMIEGQQFGLLAQSSQPPLARYISAILH